MLESELEEKKEEKEEKENKWYHIFKRKKIVTYYKKMSLTQ